MKKVKKILNMLNDRKGFDGWWDDIDEEIQNEIAEEIRKIIED